MQASYEIKHHPVNLERHGLNIYGAPLYRVVWADSRISKVICRGKRFEIPRYQHEPEVKGHFVLEKWAPPEVIVGMTREQYEDMLATIPNAAAEEYPERGEYELSYVFRGEVDEVWLHRQLDFHEARFRNTTTAEKLEQFKAKEDKKENQEEEEFEQVYEQAREETLNAK